MGELLSEFIPDQHIWFYHDLEQYEYLNRNFNWKCVSRDELYVVLQMAFYLEAIDEGRIVRPTSHIDKNHTQVV